MKYKKSIIRRQVYRLESLSNCVKKGIVIGIAVIIIIVGIALAIPIEDNKVNDQNLPSEINLEEEVSVVEEEVSVVEEEVSVVEEEESDGKDITVELTESLGLSGP